VEIKSSETTRLLDGNCWIYSAKFNPGNSSQFLLLYNNELSTYSIETDYQVAEDSTVSEEHRLVKLKEYKADL